jgi:hypothetical protein
MVTNGEWEQYVDLVINPLHYKEGEVKKFRGDNLVTGFLAKSQNIPLQVDPAEVALNTFLECEADCARFNDWMRKLDPESDDARRLFQVKRVFNTIMGDLSPKMVEYMSNNFGIGQGSTTSTSMGGRPQFAKFGGSPHLTESLIPFYKAILGDRWHEIARNPKIVKGNRYSDVAKSAKTRRPICIEPDLNVYGQKGIGRGIRRRLALCGNSINTQTRNQEMARRAYSDGLCTIDLKGASERIARLLVDFLNDDRWRHIMNLFRSPETRMPNKEYILLEKYSSTGNGFTFELETAIFLAAVRTVVPVERWDDCSVYGDDIICPSEFYSDVVDLLNLMGFVVNEKKSFKEGLFFESCGTDYFIGQPVRACYARGTTTADDEGNLTSVPYALRLANKIRLMCNRFGYGLYCDSVHHKTWKLAVGFVPTGYRKCRVPAHLGDVGLIADFNEGRNNRKRLPDWLEGWSIKTLHVPPSFCESRSRSARLYTLRSAGSRSEDLLKTKIGLIRDGFCITSPFYNRFPLRGLFGMPRPLYIPVSYWDSGFEWSK